MDIKNSKSPFFVKKFSTVFGERLEILINITKLYWFFLKL